MSDREYSTTTSAGTLGDFLMLERARILDAASTKFVRTPPARNIGELYPAYHQRVLNHIGAEAVKCQQFVEVEMQVARAVGKARFG